MCSKRFLIESATGSGVPKEQVAETQRRFAPSQGDVVVAGSRRLIGRSEAPETCQAR
jgi:hypothetical protein